MYKRQVLRTSWVIGEGKNFVRTMQQLAANGVSPTVVDDQVGRLTFTSELARATRHLLDVGAPYGTYNVSNGGDPTSFADVARASSSSPAAPPTTSPRSRPRTTSRARTSPPARCTASWT